MSQVRVQKARAEAGDWVYGTEVSHLVEEVYTPKFSSVPHAVTKCGKDLQVGSTTVSTRRVEPDSPQPRCEKCDPQPLEDLTPYYTIEQ